MWHIPVMKIWLPLAAAALLATPANASPCVTLGDSLTFAYEAEFGFRISVPFGDTYGDGFGPQVRNWVEILRDPTYRGSQFDFGGRDTFELDFIIRSYRLLFRHKNNWALPGLRIFELRDFMEGTLTFEDLVAADPELALLLEFAQFETPAPFELTDLQDQIRNTAERLVFFIGGNDVRGVYGTIYNGGSAQAFIDSYIADATAILDIVQNLNPDLPVVVVNVPHIGITPDIKQGYPTNAIATGRVTTALRELNRRLKEVADARGYGYADVFTPTLPLLSSAPFSVQGIPFLNSGSTTGSLDYFWLNGEYSANFHPNTHGQALIANEIIDAFNTHYGAGIAPLTATEILGGLIGKSAAQIDMPFTTWMASYGLTGLGSDEDSDGDGIPALVEFGLGLSPLLHDSRKLASGLRDGGSGGQVFELAYPMRLTNSPRFALTPAHSPDPFTPFTPISPAPLPGPDGLARAWLPVVPGGREFFRMENRLVPTP
jgi:hypothetical protein